MLATDIDTDPRWQPFKTRPLEAGLRACWSTPIQAKDGRVIGTFAFYFRECRAPSRRHQRIVDALVQPLRIGAKQVPMSASMGISLYPDNATDIDTLIQQADAAMYKAKQAGRSTFRFFSADMDRLAEQRLEHSAALRNAIA